ncbi:MAG: hypothetical protein HY225_04305 [Candidatus Vogelbacteria bacterium]|nr:hypothetical protein [Candidatus Vogelbacteria bacterium]
MVAKQYVSITDFFMVDQARQMRDLMLRSSELVLGVGVMASWKTIKGLPTKWINSFPPIQTVAGIFEPDSRVFNVLHYASDVELDRLFEQLVVATLFGGANMEGLQLDIEWPDVEALKLYKKYFPRVKIVLQVGPKALETVNHSAKEIARRVAEEYAPYIDYVLLDGSGGRGIPMEAGPLLEKIAAIKERAPGLAIAVAGGLGPNTLDLLEPILAVYPNISIDAQGKLRKDKTDRVDWDMAGGYVKKFVDMWWQAGASRDV